MMPGRSLDAMKGASTARTAAASPFGRLVIIRLARTLYYEESSSSVFWLRGHDGDRPGIRDDRDFDLINATGYAIKEVYIDESSSTNWTDNEVSGTFGDGEKIRFKFGKGEKGCKWDMKVVWTDNSSSIWHNFNLCEINSIKLKYNKATDESSAETN
jgi:hypothetical protein